MTFQNFFLIEKLLKMVSIVNSVDTTHEDMVHDAQMDFYGTKLATCSSDKTIKIFSVSGSHNTHQNASTLIADLRGHEGHVWQIAWAHPMYGSVLASCGYDKRVIVWKEQAPSSADGTAFGQQQNMAPRWEKIYEYKEHQSSVNSVCWAPYDLGLILAAGSSDGTISIHTYQQADKTWEVKRIQNAHTVNFEIRIKVLSLLPFLFDYFSLDAMLFLGLHQPLQML